MVALPRRTVTPIPAQCSDGSSLPREFLLSWARNFTVLVRAVQDAFAPCAPTLIYHTAPIPRINDGMVGTLVTPQLGTKHIMHQVSL